MYYEHCPTDGSRCSVCGPRPPARHTLTGLALFAGLLAFVAACVAAVLYHLNTRSD